MTPGQGIATPELAPRTVGFPGCTGPQRAAADARDLASPGDHDALERLYERDLLWYDAGEFEFLG